MKKYVLVFSVFFLCFLAPVESSAKKRRVFLRKWSLSFTNGWTFTQRKKSSAKDTLKEPWGEIEGQMQAFFSSLEIARNLGYYEIGAKIQTNPAFISPFFKWNWNKNNSRASIIPSVTLGFVPTQLMGCWLRLGLGLSLNRYVSLEPFIGTYTWYKIKELANYEKYDWHLNTGLRINLYY